MGGYFAPRNTQGMIAHLEELPTATLGWLAGMIDGEGHVSILRGPHSRRSIVVGVANTYKPALEEMQYLCGMGGAVYLVDKGQRGRRKPCYRWQVVGHSAAALLEVLLPYLRVKHGHALLALEFQNSRNTQGKRRTQEQKDNDERLIAAIRILNQRGMG